MFKNVSRDIARYILTDKINSKRELVDLFFNYSFLTVLSYRFGRWIRYEFKIPVLRILLKLLTKISHGVLTLLTGIDIRFETKIGPGLYIGHVGFLIIHPRAVIGRDCNIGVGVVIGQAGRGEKKGWPVIGDRVYIAPGAKVIGRVRIGNDVAIGANAVVTKDIPDGATAVGVPAKVVNYAGSQGLIRY